jgi:hypothetical protein
MRAHADRNRKAPFRKLEAPFRTFGRCECKFILPHCNPAAPDCAVRASDCKAAHCDCDGAIGCCRDALSASARRDRRVARAGAEAEGHGPQIAAANPGSLLGGRAWGGGPGEAGLGGRGGSGRLSPFMPGRCAAFLQFSSAPGGSRSLSPLSDSRQRRMADAHPRRPGADAGSVVPAHHLRRQR